MFDQAEPHETLYEPHQRSLVTNTLALPLSPDEILRRTR